MRKPIVTIFYQFNPWVSSIGGIQTIIRSFLKYAPQEFDLRLVGTGTSNSSLGRWQEVEYAGRSLQFMPLIAVADDNTRGVVPTTLKYTKALLGCRFNSDFNHFHRLEPSLASLNWSGDKTLFIHNDIKQQIQAQTNQQTILWQHCPHLYFALESLLIRQFDQIFSCNSASTKLYRELYPQKANQVANLKNAVDQEIFFPLNPQQRTETREALAREMGLPSTTKFILFAGRLHPQKDPILLIRAFAALKEPNTHLLIAGDGDMVGEVNFEIGSCGLLQKVTMLGAVSQARLAQLHQLSSLCILTSLYEGLPVVVLEALSCGTPIVTTNCGETPKLLCPEAGIVTRERTPEAIAQALAQILQHPEQYSAASCLRIAQPHGASNVVREVYQNMWECWQQRLLSSPTPAFNN